MITQGGIEKYLLEFPDGGYWQGKNFVFDKREAIGVGCFEGVGGIVKEVPKSKSADKGGKDKKGADKASDEGNFCYFCVFIAHTALVIPSLNLLNTS